MSSGRGARTARPVAVPKSEKSQQGERAECGTADALLQYGPSATALVRERQHQ